MAINVSSSQCLTFGFIRETIEDIDGWDIIPSDVIGLCHTYYTVPINIFLFCGNQFGKEDHNLNGMICVNMNEKKRVNFRIYNAQTDKQTPINEHDDAEEILFWSSSDSEHDQIKPKHVQTNDATLNTDWNTIKSGYCYASCIELPSFVMDKYTELNDLTHYSKLCGVFKCGGRISSTFSRITNVSAMLFRCNDMNWNKREYDETIAAYHLSLPSTPIPATVECIYSNYYGLFNIYDGSKSVYRLPFGEIGINSDFDAWEWMKMKRMHYTHYKGSLCVINGEGSRYNEQLFICGGYSFDGNKCELLDIHRNVWRKLPHLMYKVSQSGIKYDFCSNRIYIGGGSRTYSKQRNASNLCSFYDVKKNKWYKLPNTNCEHCHHPLLFINDRAPNVLYVAGNDQHDIGYCEFLDLRVNKKRWQMVTDDAQLNYYFKVKKNALIKRLVCA
eukprot:108328_1